MQLRLRLLLDTNILIPLQDSYVSLNVNLQNLIRLANIGGHQLLYHPASIEDFQRDPNTERRDRTLPRLGQYQRLENTPVCPWNTGKESPNDACDNEILYALECEAAHALITEDKGIHAKAKARGLSNRVYYIQTAEDWLRRLHERAEVRLPNIEDVPLYSLTPELSSGFFDSLREDYKTPPFDNWFRKKSQEGRRAWLCRNDAGALGGICIYTIQEDEEINDQGRRLNGRALKLCTFKVGELVRGRKIGELFLKAAFRYATENMCIHIFVHGNAQKQPYLATLLEDFGFIAEGDYGGDVVWVKEHPIKAPVTDIAAPEYIRRFFPHFRQDPAVGKYLVPIRPQYHDILFPDYYHPERRQMTLLDMPNKHAGNAIKLAYLCHTQTNTVSPGDILLFYRTEDEQAVTTLGIVEAFNVSKDPSTIAALVSRRTVYSVKEIEKLTEKDVKIILFRLIKHVSTPVSYNRMRETEIVAGPIQSLTKLNESKYRRLARDAGI